MSLLRITKNESEFRLVREMGDPQDAGFTLVRVLENVHATAADTIVNALNVKRRISSPQADRQSYSGTFISARIEPQMTQGDRADVHQALVRVRNSFRESEATLVSQEGDPNHVGFKIRRAWKYIDPEAADTIVTAINLKDTQGSPKADRQSYSGTFVISRVEPVKEEDKTVSIHQYLTKVKSTTDSGDADLVRIDGDPSVAGTTLHRAWHYISPTAADSLYTTLLAITSYASGIKADEQLYSGRFWASKVQPVGEDDRSVTIHQSCVKTGTRTDSATAILLATDGDPQHAGFRVTRGWQHIDPGSADTLATALNAVLSYSSGIKVGGHVYSDTFINTSVHVRRQEDNTELISQVCTKVKSAIDSADADLISIIGDPSAAGTVIERGWYYISPSAADGLYATMNAIKSYASGIKADAQLYSGKFLVSRVHPVVEEDRSATIRQTCRKVATQTDSASAILAGTEGDPQRAGFKVRRLWRYIDPASADTIMTNLATKQIYSTGIKADAKLYNDTFIGSGIEAKRDEDESQQVFQLCTKVKSATDSADADLLNIEGDPKVAGSTIRRAWHYISPTAADGLYTTLNAITKYSSGIKADAQLYSGVFVVSRVVPETTDDRTVRISQFCKKVTSIASDTSLLRPLVDREKEILHPFGEGTGTRWGIIFRYPNLDPTTDTKCMAFLDTTLEKKMDVAKTYDLIDRKTETQDDRTMTFFLLSRKVSRTAWTTTKYQTPDRKMYENRGRGHEVRRLLWYGVNRNHHDSVTGDLIDANSDTGFRTVNVTWQDDDVGAKDYVWLQVKSTTDTRTDSAIENTHGVEHLALRIKHRDYSDYKTSTLPSDPAMDTGYAFSTRKISMNARGLIDKTVLRTKAAASNPVTVNAGAARYKVQLREPPRGQAAVDSTGCMKALLYDRVPIAKADSAVRDMGIPDTKYVTDGISFNDYGDGSGRVIRRKIRVNTAAKYYVRMEEAALGSSDAGMQRVWPRVWDTKATALIDSGGDARTDTKYQGITYFHSQCFRDPHGDGTTTVTQLLRIPSYGHRAPGANETLDSVYAIHYGERKRGTAEYVVPSLSRITIYIKKCSTAATAQAWSDSSHLWDGRNIKEGRVQSIGNGKWLAYKVKYVKL